MKLFTIILAFFLTGKALGQTQQSIDSVINNICISITNSTETDDSAKVFHALQQHALNPMLSLPQDKREEFMDRIFLRLQIKCRAFSKITEKMSPENKDWVTVPEMPASDISKADCDNFFTMKNLKYVEPMGDTTRLTIQNNLWTDNLHDGSYSKLQIKRTSNTDFDLFFIESNHIFKSKLSFPGDRYAYRLVKKEKNYYLVCVNVPEADKFSLFKVYY